MRGHHEAAAAVTPAWACLAQGRQSRAPSPESPRVPSQLPFPAVPVERNPAFPPSDLSSSSAEGQRRGMLHPPAQSTLATGARTGQATAGGESSAPSEAQPLGPPPAAWRVGGEPDGKQSRARAQL